MSQELTRSLLIVDDEEFILTSLKRLFRRCKYQVFTATSGDEALDILATQVIGVIISDQRMPEMDGTEFLKRSLDISPDSIRIMLSGFTDLKSVTVAINDAAIFKFLTKPWEDESLIENIAKAFEFYELKTKNESLTKELTLKNELLAQQNQDLHRLNQEREKLIQLKSQVLESNQELIEGLPIGVIVFDAQGAIDLHNHKAINELNRLDEALLSQSIFDITCEESQKHIKSYLENLHCTPIQWHTSTHTYQLIKLGEKEQPIGNLLTISPL